MFHIADRVVVSHIPPTTPTHPTVTVIDTLKCLTLLTEYHQVYIPHQPPTLTVTEPLKCLTPADRVAPSIPSPIPTVTEILKCFMLLTEQCQVYLGQGLSSDSSVSNKFYNNDTPIWWLNYVPCFRLSKKKSQYSCVRSVTTHCKATEMHLTVFSKHQAWTLQSGKKCMSH